MNCVRLLVLALAVFAVVVSLCVAGTAEALGQIQRATQERNEALVVVLDGPVTAK
jgi:hypothetical protein